MTGKSKQFKNVKCLSCFDHKEIFKTTANCLVSTTFTTVQISAFKLERYKDSNVLCVIIIKSTNMKMLSSVSWHYSGEGWSKSRRLKSKHFENSEVMSEWIMHLYSVLCIVVHPKRFTIMWGGVSPQPPPVCSIHMDDATAATGQRHQCAHHTPATGGEERES